MATSQMIKKWSRWKTICLTLLISLLLPAVWGFVIEPDRLIVREISITLPSCPSSLKGLRIAALSDLHVGAPYITLDKVRQIVAAINKARPDLILIPGDFVIQGVPGGNFIEPEAAAYELRGLDNLSGMKSRLGVFATLGNHDWWYNGPRIKRALEDVGIRVLENDVVKIERLDVAIWIAGFGDLWEGSPDITKTLAKVTDDAPIIALTHNPDLFPQIPSKVALTIAGHTHGGQVSLPIIGRPIVPSQFGQRYAYGHIEEAGKHLFVTSGIGTSILPVRFRVTPEISLLTIN